MFSQRFRLSNILALVFVLSSLVNDVCSLQGILHRRAATPMPPPCFTTTALSQSTKTSSVLVQNTQLVEEDFRYDRVQVAEIDNVLAKVSNKVMSMVRFDKQRVAKLGVSFGVTYSVISNINGSISLSLAWFIASKRTGLSPLAPGQWKSLLSSYGGLYLFLTLARPLRVALAVAMTKTTNEVLENIQMRFDCSRATAIGAIVASGLVAWALTAAGGVALASAASGVPIW